MRVIDNLGELQPAPASCVLTIGNFDGVHLAPYKLLDRVVKLARLEVRSPPRSLSSRIPSSFLPPLAPQSSSRPSAERPG